MINPAQTIFYHPPEINKPPKRDLFIRIGRDLEAQGGKVTNDEDVLAMGSFDGLIPIVGCSPQLTGMIADWRKREKPFIYWDRGYVRRVYATWLPRGENGGYYRWHVNAYQMQNVRDAPPERWRALQTPVQPWRKQGKHIVVAKPSRTYSTFHGLTNCLDETVYKLSLVTERQLVVRDKESKRPLLHDVACAHALVTHGSNAAVEAVILGCPVFVHESSAAALVGKTDLSEIETPAYPDRQPWLRSLAYCQFTENELIDGTLWRLLS